VESQWRTNFRVAELAPWYVSNVSIIFDAPCLF
jgi:hypothetical protein